MKLNKLIFELYKAYDFATIDGVATVNGFAVVELGKFLIGEHFIILKNGDSTITFVLTCETTYKCIFKFLENDNIKI